MSNYLKYSIAIVPVIGIIAMAAMFGKLGVRPRALAVIKPSGIEDPSEIGFWAARQTRQKIFRNNLVFFGYDPSAPESLKVLEGFLTSSQKDGPKYDVLISKRDFNISGVLNINLGEKATPQELGQAASTYLENSKRVVVVLETPQTSKLVKTSIARTFEFELGKKLAAFSVLKQKSTDLSSLREADVCSAANKLSFEKSETLRCLFLPLQNKLEKELDKSSKPIAAAVEQYGLDDYFVYLYTR